MGSAAGEDLGFNTEFETAKQRASLKKNFFLVYLFGCARS